MLSDTDLQEVHDEEEGQQKGWGEEQAVQEQPLHSCQVTLRRDPGVHEEVEEVAHGSCEEEPEAPWRV